MTGPLHASISDIVETVTNGLVDRTLTIGPLVWQPSDGAAARVNYVIIGAADKDGFHCNRIIMQDDSDRLDLIMALAHVRPALVVHICDDELYMSQLCETLWPCQKTRRIAAALIAERAAV